MSCIVRAFSLDPHALDRIRGQGRCNRKVVLACVELLRGDKTEPVAIEVALVDSDKRARIREPADCVAPLVCRDASRGIGHDGLGRGSESGRGEGQRGEREATQAEHNGSKCTRRRQYAAGAEQQQEVRRERTDLVSYRRA